MLRPSADTVPLAVCHLHLGHVTTDRTTVAAPWSTDMLYRFTLLPSRHSPVSSRRGTGLGGGAGGLGAAPRRPHGPRVSQHCAVPPQRDKGRRSCREAAPGGGGVTAGDCEVLREKHGGLQPCGLKHEGQH